MAFGQRLDTFGPRGTAPPHGNALVRPPRRGVLGTNARTRIPLPPHPIPPSAIVARTTPANRRHRGYPRCRVRAGGLAHPAGAQEGFEAASAAHQRLPWGAGGTQRRAHRPVLRHRVRRRGGHLGAVQRPRQPLRACAEGGGIAARRRGQRDDGEPHRVPGRRGGAEQARRHGRPHQHELARAPANALRVRHRVQEMRVRQRGWRSNRAGEERTRSEGRRGLLHGAGWRGANAQLGRGSGRRERRAAGHQPARHRRDHARRDGDVHLHLRHHRLAQGGGALQSPLLGQRPFGRARRVPLHGARSHLHLPAALPRHRVVGRRGRRVRQRRLDVRAPAVFGAGVPARNPRARVYVLHLCGRAVPLPARFARQAGRCGFALGHRDGQRPAAGRVDGFQDALRPQTHHRVLRRQRRQRGVRQSAEQRPHHRHDVLQSGVGALRRGRGRSRARQRRPVR